MKRVLFIAFAIVAFISCKNDKKASQPVKEETKTQATSTTNPTEESNIMRGVAHSQPQQKFEGTVIRKVSVEEAEKLAQQGYQFLDIRTKDEIERGKIKDAMEMNVKAYDFQSKVNLMERDIKLIVYCSAGNRSALASKLFSTLGFTNVVEMPGGYSEWRTKHNLK